MILRQLGNVLTFADFAKNKLEMNETITFELNKNGGDIQIDVETIDAIWSVILSECGGKMENMFRFLQKGTDSIIGEREVVSHIMDLVDSHLNNDVVIKKGHQFIKNFDEFMEKATKIDYNSVVEVLVRRLIGEDDKDMPKFLGLVTDLLKTTTDCDCGDGEWEEEEE